jgi:3-methyladenine DNA glycosylase/8-oxoguanine DNA glycosylase
MIGGIMAYFEYGEKEMTYLLKKDKKLGAMIDRIGIIKREVTPDLFTALIDSVISQQISAKAADTVSARLRDKSSINAESLSRLTMEDIQSCGMSMRKAEYIKNIAESAATRTANFDTLPQQSDEAIIKTRTAIKGVGIGTVEMLLIFSLMRPNVVSYGDLAIRRGMMRLYGHKDLPRTRFDRYAKRYAPYGSTASLYLWEISHADFGLTSR